MPEVNRDLDAGVEQDKQDVVVPYPAKSVSAGTLGDGSDGS